jgi:hypothetical protein
MTKRYSRPGAALASASLALATLFLLAAGDAGLAAPAKGKAVRQAAPIERTAPADEAAADKPATEPKAAFTVLQGKPGVAAEPAATGSAGNEESCFTARRKLWVDGEGWIVRRVTTCR